MTRMFSFFPWCWLQGWVCFVNIHQALHSECVHSSVAHHRPVIKLRNRFGFRQSYIRKHPVFFLNNTQILSTPPQRSAERSQMQKHISFQKERELKTLGSKAFCETERVATILDRGLQQLWVQGNTLIFHSPKPSERMRKVDSGSQSLTFNNCHAASTRNGLARFMPFSTQSAAVLASFFSYLIV